MTGQNGRIVRRLLRDISEQGQLADVATLANADIVGEIAAKASASTEDERRRHCRAAFGESCRLGRVLGQSAHLRRPSSEGRHFVW